MTEENKVSKAQALVQLYNTMNHPCTSGPKWVKYSHKQVEAMLDVVKQLALNEGAEFSPFDVEFIK